MWFRAASEFAEMSSEEKPSKGLRYRTTEEPLHVSTRFIGFSQICCLCVELGFWLSRCGVEISSRRDRPSIGQKSEENETYEE